MTPSTMLVTATGLNRFVFIMDSPLVHAPLIRLLIVVFSYKLINSHRNQLPLPLYFTMLVAFDIRLKT